MKFTKKIEIDAVQFTGQKAHGLVVGLAGVCDCGKTMRGIPNGCQPHVHVGLDKKKRIDLKVGDWIVSEDGGKTFYPVSEKEFLDTYGE
jgi:hypothetical protein